MKKEQGAVRGDEWKQEPLGTDDCSRELIAAVADLDEEAALKAIDQLIEDNSGEYLLNLALEGLNIVGRRYEAGEYYLAGLVMAGEITRQILQLISARSPTKILDIHQVGVVVLGTIEGDIHDLGKDLVKEVLTANGFKVHDLGVDVAPEMFLAETIRCQPDIVGISILISSSYPALTKAVTQLKTLIPAGFKRPGILIGGGAVDDIVFEHAKADLWRRDLMSIGEACRAWVAAQKGLPKTEPITF